MAYDMSGSPVSLAEDTVNSGSPVNLRATSVTYGLDAATYVPEQPAGSAIPQSTVQYCGLNNPAFSVNGLIDLTYSQPSPKDKIDKTLLESYAKATGTKVFCDKDMVGTGSILVHIVSWRLTRAEKAQYINYSLDLVETK